MNHQAIEINDKYCVVDKDNSVSIMQKEENDITFKSILELENHLEENKSLLKRTQKHVLEKKDDIIFFSIIGIVGLIIMYFVLPLKSYEFFAPLTISVYSLSRVIINTVEFINLRKSIPNIQIIIGNISSNLESLKRKAKVEEKNIHQKVDKNNQLELEELRRFVLNEFSDSIEKENIITLVKKK